MWFLIVLFAAIHVGTINSRFKWLFYITKPAPIILLIVSLLWSNSISLPYLQLIALGLFLSLIGDVFLMHPNDKFLSGLSFFLIAHICYFAAFIGQISPSFAPWPIVTLMALGALVYKLIYSRLDKIKVPVAIYIIVILCMAWAAIEYRSFGYNQSAAFAFTGSIMFLLSDFVLAVDRFRAPSFLTRQVVMITYYSAQAFIALSALTFF